MYDFNGDWILVNGCINSVSYCTRSIYNNTFFEYETFVLYFNGGSWVIGKESNINGYWLGAHKLICLIVIDIFGLMGIMDMMVIDTRSNFQTCIDDIFI